MNSRLGIQLLLICDKQGLKNLHSPSGEILELAYLIQLNCSEYGLQTLIMPTKRFRVFVLRLQCVCAQNGFEVRLEVTE
jgi:hypothetical protein